MKAVRPESSDSWEGAASIALAVKTLGLEKRCEHVLKEKVKKTP